jgi:ABC-2 type transport system permease protein
MRREGSPWTGLGAVFLKEFADHLSSTRMRVLEWLVLLVGVGAVWASLGDIKAVTTSDPFLLLRVFTVAREPKPSFLILMTFLIPLVSIALTFDAVNSEFNHRTLSRVLSQPVYRDAVLLGKFLAALATLAVSLTVLWLLVFGLTLIMLGVPPSTEEVARAFAFLLVTLGYAGVWLAIAILFSVVFRSAATSALCSYGLWFVVSVLWSFVVSFIVDALAPNEVARLLGVQSVEQLQWQLGLARLSPNVLYTEAVLPLLDPATRTLGLVFPADLVGAVRGSPLPFDQSVLVAWPQITALFAAVIALFALTYVLFQRQEIRA